MSVCLSGTEESLLTHACLLKSVFTAPFCSVCALVDEQLWWQVSSGQRGVNGSQVNIGGTGLGSFNDRFRDAVVGGSPFASPLFQGWATGMSTASFIVSAPHVSVALVPLVSLQHVY